MQKNKKKQRKSFILFLKENIKTVLFVCVCLVFAGILITKPTVTYIQMQTELNRMQNELVYEQEKQVDYDEELDKWNNKEFVIAKARERLRFIMPGEILLKVTDYDENFTNENEKDTTSSKDKKYRNTWYLNLFDSIKISDSVDTKKK